MAVDRHFVIWGVAQGAEFMLPSEGIRFVAVKFLLLWEGRGIGEISFAKSSDAQEAFAGNRSRELEESTQSGNLSTLAPSNDFEQAQMLTSTNLLNASDDDVRIYCRLFGYDVEPNDVFRLVISGLSSIAPIPATQRIPRFRTEADYGSLRINLERPHPRGYPPFFEARHAIKALGVLPQYMLDKGLFSEVDIKIQVPNVLLAEGEMALRRRPPHINAQ